MGLVGKGVKMGNVPDVDGFVNAAINRLGLTLGRDERDELELYGFEIICQLHRDFDGRGTFSGHCAVRLPQRLITAWHTMHRGEHIRTRNADGRCVWTYQTQASWEQVTEGPGFDERRVATITRFQKPAPASPLSAAA